MTEPVPFRDACVLEEHDGVLLGRLSEDWAQGRAAFGGLLTGFGLRAADRLVAPDRRLRSALITFVSPASLGLIAVQATLQRSGRALTQVSVTLTQADQVRAQLLLAYGADRPSPLAWPPQAAPALPAPDELPALPYLPGITPAFTRHFQYRWGAPGVPFSGSSHAEVGGWVRHAQPTPADAASVLALIDAWPGPILPLMTRPAPASTVTWMVDLCGDPASMADDAWWHFQGDTVSASAGYATVEGRLWGDGGRLVAVSRQLVAEFS